MSTQDTAIHASELSRHFGDTKAVDQLNLDIPYGEVFGFLGHNGAGKTTTIRLLNGVLTPTSGKASVLGLSTIDDGSALRRQTGVLTETPSLDERLTARDNLRIFADLYEVPKPQTSARVEELLAVFELSDHADDKVGTYSKGMKQRLALARALIHHPQLLFLDEPTSGLDPVATRQVHDLIQHLSQDQHRTVFICTHNLNEAQKLCNRVAVLEHGKLLALGTPTALMADYATQVRSIEIEVEPDSVAPSLNILHNIHKEATHDKGIITIKNILRESIPDLLAVMVNAGIRIYRVAPDEPTLEDVYFALHGIKEEQET